MEGLEFLDTNKHSDRRGWVAWPIPEKMLQSGEIHNIHVPLLKPGAIRGNHYHSNTTEYVLVQSEPCSALFKNRTTGEQQESALNGGGPFLIKISPDIIHAFKNTGNSDIVLICFEERPPGSPESDCIRQVILP